MKHERPRAAQAALARYGASWGRAGQFLLPRLSENTTGQPRITEMSIRTGLVLLLQNQNLYFTIVLMNDKPQE